MMPPSSQLVQITRREKIVESDFHALILELNKLKLRNLLPPQVPIESLPTKVANNVLTPSAAPVPDCMTCGACCVFLLGVSVKPTDATSQTHFWKITNETKSGELVVDQFMRRNPETMACMALSGNLGETVGCQIYEERPQVCREFEAGSDKCHALRRTYGIEPPLDEARVLEANFRVELLKSKVLPAEKLLYAEIIPHPETEELVIVAVMENGSREAIHVYNPHEESWLQTEFASLNLLDAYRLIQSRRAKREDN